MKRFAAFIITALLAVTSVFATPGKASGSGAIVKPATAETEVVLNLKAEDLAAYRIGFASDVASNDTWTQTTTNMDDLPSSVGELDITNGFSSTTSKATSAQHYIFYKVRGTNSFEISLKANKPLTTKEGKEINYTVAVTGGTGSVDTAVSSSKWSDTVEMNDMKPFAADSYAFTISTYEITAGQDGDYSSSLTLSVKSV